MSAHLTSAEYKAEIERQMTEKEFQRKCEAALRELGCYVYHSYNSQKSSPGFPDLVVVTPSRRPRNSYGPGQSRLGFFELKRQERGRLSGHQEEWLDALGEVEGVTVKVIRPSDLNWLISWARGGKE